MNLAIIFAIEKLDDAVPVFEVVIDSIVTKLLLVEYKPLGLVFERNDFCGSSLLEEVRGLRVIEVGIAGSGEIERNEPAAVGVVDEVIIDEESLLSHVELLGGCVDGDVNDRVAFMKGF